MRSDALKFAKERYFNGYSDTRSVKQAAQAKRKSIFRVVSTRTSTVYFAVSEGKLSFSHLPSSLSCVDYLLSTTAVRMNV